MSEVDFIPRRSVADRLAAGWRLVPGHTYRTDDWAFLMTLHVDPEPMTAAAIRTLAAQFHAPTKGAKVSTKDAGYKSSRETMAEMQAARRNDARARRRKELAEAREAEKWAWALRKMEAA